MAPTRQLLASVLRTAIGQLSPQVQIEAAHQKGVSAGHKLGEESAKFRTKQLEEELARWKTLAKEFEEASGIRLGDYHYHGGKTLGEAARMVMQGAHVALQDRLQTLRRTAEGIVKVIDENLNVTEGGKT